MSAPKGNKNATKGREFQEALRYALINYEGNGVKRKGALKAVAMKLIDNAVVDGDISAIKEIADRMDGKAHQSTTVNVEDNRDLGIDELRQRIADLDSRIAEHPSGTGGTAGTSTESPTTH